MAEHYLQFAEVLSLRSAAEVDWWRQQLELVYVFGDQEFTERELPPDLSPDYAAQVTLRGLGDLVPEDEDEEPGFEFELRTDRGSGPTLWFYAAASGRPESVAHLVQKFLRALRPHDCWHLTYATSCDKPRSGQFAGGAIFVTAEAMEHFQAGQFIDERRRAFAVQHPSSFSERIRA